MKFSYLFIFLLLETTLFSLTLQEYIYIALRDSSDSINYKESIIYSQYNLENIQNKFNFSIVPNSSATANSDEKTLSLGVSVNKPTQIGGEFYTSVRTTRTESTHRQTSYNSQTVLGYKQSLFKRWGLKYNNQDILNAKQRYQLIKSKNRYINSQIILKAVEQYYNVILTHKRVKIYEESCVRAEKEYAFAQAKYSVGSVSSLDTHRAKLKMYSSQKNLEDAKKSYLDSVDDMLYFINHNNQKIEIDMDVSIFIQHFEVKYNQTILDDNINYKQKILDKRILEDKIFLVKRDFLPDVTLDINYKMNGYDKKFSNSFDNMYQDKDANYNISISSSYNFNTQSKKINYKKIIMERSKLNREIHELTRFIIKDITSKQNRYESLKFNLNLSKSRVDETELSFKAAKIKHMQGVGTNFDILIASQELENAKIEYISNILNYNKAILTLADSQNILDYNFIMELINNTDDK